MLEFWLFMRALCSALTVAGVAVTLVNVDELGDGRVELLGPAVVYFTFLALLPVIYLGWLWWMKDCDRVVQALRQEAQS